MNKAIRVYDIEWHYNYEDHADYLTKEEYDKEFDSEPTEMIVDVSDWEFDENDDPTDIDNIQQCLTNYLEQEAGYYVEDYNWEWIDETEQIEQVMLEIEKSSFPTINFDEFGPSEKYDGLYYSRGIGEVDGEEVDVTIYYDPATEEVRISIEELEEDNK